MSKIVMEEGSQPANVYKERLLGEELIWLKQFRKILAPYLQAGVTMLDLGCATGYAYKSFKHFGIKYTGIDFDLERLKLGGQYFKGNHNVDFLLYDLRDPLPLSANIVICDATLEHLPKIQPTLGYMADAAKGILLFRAYLGEKEILVPCDEVGTNWALNQYAFDDILPFLEARGFRTKVYRCEYTDSMPIFKHGHVRRQYVVFAIRSDEDCRRG